MGSGFIGSVGPAPLNLRIELLREALQAHNQVTLTARGSSMLPTIRPGEPFTVCAAVPAPLRVGEIVQVRSGDETIVHRIIRITADPDGPLFLTKGDNLLLPDPPARAADILGRVVAIRGRRLDRLDRRTLHRLLGWLGRLQAAAYRLLMGSRLVRSLGMLKFRYLCRASVPLAFNRTLGRLLRWLP